MGLSPSKSHNSLSCSFLTFEVFLERVLLLPVEAQGSRNSLHTECTSLCVAGRGEAGELEVLYERPLPCVLEK